MTRREAILLLSGSPPLDLFVKPAQGCAVVLEVRTRRVIAHTGSDILASPGSTLKPFVLASLIRTGRLNAIEAYRCPGTLRIAGRDFSCSHPRMETPLRVATALAYSCNCFVTHVAGRFRPGELADELRRYGFGSQGSVRRATSEDEQRLQVLGEDAILTTVSELASAYRLLAGSLPASILTGLEEAVQFGTAQHAQVAGQSVAGKTGTALSAAGEPLAWFAGFVPSRRPEVVVAVMLKGRSGGADAAPVAGKILSAFVAPAIKLKTGGNTLSLPLEQYVAAVITGESSVFGSDEALKAMAVIARTYAVRMRGRHSSEGFDFCETTHCQRIELGRSSARVNAAVAGTGGELLWFKGKPAFTPYSRDCGGRTEDASAVWPELAAPYLVSHVDLHSQSAWQWPGEKRAVANALREAGLQTPHAIDRVLIAERTASGRARTLLLSGSKESVRISAGSFRFAIGRALGWNTIRSDWYQARIDGTRIVCDGKGSGHGVGLCQLGADEMGRQGRSYREILAWYYPGTVLGLTAAGLAWQRLSGDRVTLWTVQPAQDKVVLALAERLGRELEQRTGWPLPHDVTIRVYPDLDTFRNATGEPGWVAGYTERRHIHLQPVQTLRSRDVLESTLKHELAHVAMEAHVRADLPVWFQEALANYLAGVHNEQESKVAALVRRYGETTIFAWVARGLPPEVTNASMSQPPMKSR